jgi:hypothetical protein
VEQELNTLPEHLSASPVFSGIRVTRSFGYQRGNQNSYIEEEQTTQWRKEKMSKGQTTIYKTYTLNRELYNTTDGISGSENAYPSGAQEFTIGVIVV